MSEYSRIRNEHDRAVVLAQLVNADARLVAALLPTSVGIDYKKIAVDRLQQSRDELWKLIGPASEQPDSEASK